MIGRDRRAGRGSAIELERVGRRRTFLVVIEIDVDVAPSLVPGPDAASPVSQRVGTIMSLVTAAGTVASDVDKISVRSHGAGAS